MGVRSILGATIRNYGISIMPGRPPCNAYQGRTVDNVIAAMEANHPNLTTQKSFYVEISRARDRAELVTDDATGLRVRLETATGERISALEGIGTKRNTALDQTHTPAHGRETTSEAATGALDKAQEQQIGESAGAETY